MVVFSSQNMRTLFWASFGRFPHQLTLSSWPKLPGYVKIRRSCFVARAVLPPMSKAKPNLSNPIVSGSEVAKVTVAYKTEMVNGCEVHHKDLVFKDIKIHFVECGNPQGQLVLLLHGFPNFWFVWKNQFKDLAEAGFHVIAPDLRGFNTSSKPEGLENYGRSSMLLDMMHLIDSYGSGNPAILVGHDWGGALTWALAEDFPNKLSKIVIVNSPHWRVFQSALRSNIRQQLRSWYFLFFQLPLIPETFIRFNRFWALRLVLKNGPCKPQSEEDINRHVEAYSIPGAVTASINLYRAAYAGYWHRSDTSQINIPTTVIWGELDKYIGFELAEPPSELVLNVTIKRIPQVSHWPMWDEPILFNQLLLEAIS